MNIKNLHKLELNDTGNIKINTTNFILINHLKKEIPDKKLFDSVRNSIKKGESYNDLLLSIDNYKEPIIVEIPIVESPEEKILSEILPRRRRKVNI